MGIRVKLQGRTSHVLKGNLGINKYEKEEKMLVASRTMYSRIYLCPHFVV